MRRLITWNMVSLDGYFDTPDHSLDWFHFSDEMERYIIDTQETAGTLLFGRVTYEMMATYWPTAQGRIADFMNGVEKVVFSRTLVNAAWSNTRLISENVPEEVGRLKEGDGGDIFVFGSADFSATLMQHSLIDEYRIGLNPIVLGSGIPLFKETPGRRPLKLIESRPLESGVVILHYVPGPGPAAT